MEDKRFAHIAKDPKFRRIPKGQSKVKIDKRFQSMFTDKKFQVKYTTDKRGRPVKHHSKEDLKRYYELESEEDMEGSDESSEKESDSEQETEKKVGAVSKLDVEHKTAKNLPDVIKEKLRDLNVDYARGEGALFSDSSSDDEETDDEISESEEIDHRWGELDADADQTEEVTYRLAVCNLDWDRIRALDLMVLFNSFLPPGGIIKSVVIYPSEFGKQRMKDEETNGPIELVNAKRDIPPDNETEEGSTYHMEKLRQYQLNRLKYYYAVISFDSPGSANKIYTECDGMEYESSATKIDLRFIPDNMTFDDKPKDSCEKLPDKYEPRFFTTTALQQAKVICTWDETNPDRLEFAEKMKSGKVNDFSENDLQNFLAVSSGEEEEEVSEAGESQSGDEGSQPGDAIDKYKALLAGIQEKEDEKKNKGFGMEISWGIDLKQKTDQLMKEKQKNSEETTPFQKYLDKRKEKKKDKRELKKKSKNKQEEEEGSGGGDVPSDIDMNDPYFAEEFNSPEFKRSGAKKKNKKGGKSKQSAEDKEKQAELDLLLMNEDNDKRHFSLKKILVTEEEKGKKKRGKRNKKAAEEDTAAADEFKVNVADKRFSAIFTSHHYNIDPTDPHFKKTNAMETLIREKIKRRTEDDADVAAKRPKTEQNRTKKKDLELTMLVKNVKRKAQAFKKK